MPFILKQYYPVRNVIFILGEGLLILLAILAATLLYVGGQEMLHALHIYTLRALVVTIILQLSLYFFDLYDLSHDISPMETMIRFVQAFGSSCILLSPLYALVPSLLIRNLVFWTGYLIICAVFFGWRVIYYLILQRRLFAQPVVLVGTGRVAEDITREIEDKRDSGYRLAAFVGDTPPAYNPGHAPLLPMQTDTLLEVCRQARAQRIIVALDNRRGAMPVEKLLECKLQGIEIDEGIAFYEAITGKILAEKVNPAWLVFSDGFRKSRSQGLLKRSIDVLLSGLCLLLLVPLGLLVALLITLDSRGPIFYTQQRVGEKGRTFTIIKFRSMRQDAEAGGAVWARENDSRITRVGHFIRKTRLDELPQLWNILKGEMSFVGPRPERPVFVEQLTRTLPYYSLRHTVKPGLTGWAQVSYPYGASEEDALRKLEYDLYYIKNLSIFIDLLVVFLTVKTVLCRRGGR